MLSWCPVALLAFLSIKLWLTNQVAAETDASSTSFLCDDPTLCQSLGAYSASGLKRQFYRFGRALDSALEDEAFLRALLLMQDGEPRSVYRKRRSTASAAAAVTARAAANVVSSGDARTRRRKRSADDSLERGAGFGPDSSEFLFDGSGGGGGGGGGNAEKRFMRFGKRFMRFGKRFYRFGRAPEDDEQEMDKRFMRFGRVPFMRFGRSPDKRFYRFGRYPNSQYPVFGKRFYRFGRGLTDTIGEVDDGDSVSGDPETDAMDKRFMRFGKRFMRFGKREKDDDVEDVNGNDLGVDEDGKEKRFMRFGRDSAGGDFDKRFMRFGKRENAEKRFMRFGKSVNPGLEGIMKRFMRFGKRDSNSILDAAGAPGTT